VTPGLTTEGEGGDDGCGEEVGVDDGPGEGVGADDEADPLGVGMGAGSAAACPALSATTVGTNKLIASPERSTADHGRERNGRGPRIAASRGARRCGAADMQQPCGVAERIPSAFTPSQHPTRSAKHGRRRRGLGPHRGQIWWIRVKSAAISERCGRRVAAASGPRRLGPGRSRAARG